MAKVRMPLLSGEVRGKVGEVVFFRRYGVQLARIRTKPSNPRTEKQMAVRTNLGGLAKLWKGEGDIVLKKYNPTTGMWEDVMVEEGLTNMEREAWMEEARRMGKPVVVYGRLLFIGVNAKRLAEGLDIRITP
jgi:hypothetical protein